MEAAGDQVTEGNRAGTADRGLQKDCTVTAKNCVHGTVHSLASLSRQQELRQGLHTGSTSLPPSTMGSTEDSGKCCRSWKNAHIPASTHRAPVWPSNALPAMCPCTRTYTVHTCSATPVRGTCTRSQALTLGHTRQPSTRPSPPSSLQEKRPRGSLPLCRLTLAFRDARMAQRQPYVYQQVHHPGTKASAGKSHWSAGRRH